MKYVEGLRAFPLLSNMADNELGILAEALSEKLTPAGENIITEGESGDELFILMDGVVDIIKDTVYGDQFVVSTLDAGDHCVFGEMALIEYPSSGLELLKLISLNLVRNLRKENENLRLVYQALIEEIETE